MDGLRKDVLVVVIVHVRETETQRGSARGEVLPEVVVVGDVVAFAGCVWVSADEGGLRILVPAYRPLGEEENTLKWVWK